MDPQNQNSYRTILSIVVIILIVLGGFLFLRSFKVADDNNATSTAGSVSSTTNASLASTTSAGQTTVGGVTGNGNFTVKMLGTLPAAPTYKNPLTCAASVSAQECALLQSQAATLKTQIAKNEQDFNAWMSLGTIRKNAGDTQGAITAWQYVTALYPSDAGAYDNLADLYANTLKQYAKAESNYLTGIKLDPTDTNPYIDLFTIYTTTSYTGKAGAAESILKQAIAANPKAVDLQVRLARYYRSLGRTADAKSEYAAAVSNAQAQGQSSLATEIQQEASGM